MSGSALSSASTETPAVGLLRGLRTPLLCVVFIGAVAVASLGIVGRPSLWIIVGQALLAGATTFLVGQGLARRWPNSLALAVLVIGLGCWRGAAGLESRAQPWTDAPRTTIHAEAIVDGPVEVRGETAQIPVRLIRIDGLEESQLPSGRVQITVPAPTSLGAADRLDLRGRISPVDATISFGRLLLAHGVVATASFPDVLRLSRGDPTGLLSTLQRLSAALQQTIDRALPQPEASLVTGALLGTADLPDAFRLAMSASGTTHIVVVSGYNITVVAGVLAALFHRRRVLALLVPVIGVWAFTLFVGATPPAVRAAMMATFYVSAIASGRRADPLTALLLACALICLVDPGMTASLSFQLSAVATLGLIVLQPRLAGLVPWAPSWLREPVAASLAATLATMPILTSTFHQISVVSPLANVLVDPMIPFLTIAAAVGVPIATLIPPAAPVVAAILVVPAHLIVMAIELTASFPNAIVPVGEIPPPLLIAFIFGLLVWAGAATPEGRDLAGRLRGARWVPAVAPAGLVVLCALLAAWSSTGIPPPLVLTVLDVGHGDAVFIRTPGGSTVLIDGGPNPSALLQQLGHRMGLLEHSLSIAILTQADPERLPGAVAGIERYSPTLALGPPEGSTSGLYERWMEVAPQTIPVEGPTVIEVEPGISLELTPTPPVPGVGRGGGVPRRAMMVRVLYGEVAILVAPNVPADVIRQVADEGMRADGLIVPRHGDITALSRALLATLDPQVAVISVGARNRDNLPAQATLDLLKDVPTHRTDLNGSVELRTDGTTLTVNRERDSH